MAELSNLGFNHNGQSYELAYGTLNMITPAVLTLELSLFSYDGEVWLGKLFDASLDELEWREKSLKGKRNLMGGEFQAGYIFARRHGLPLYVIDQTIVPPEEVIKHNITAMADPHEAFPYGKIPEDFFSNSDYHSRNRFMASTLDLLVPIYSNGHFAHIGGADNATRDNPEAATPVHELVTQFDKVTPYIFAQRS